MYGFHSNADLMAFLADPAATLEGVGAAARDEPLLLRLLGLPPPSAPADVHTVVQVGAEN